MIVRSPVYLDFFTYPVLHPYCGAPDKPYEAAQKQEEKNRMEVRNGFVAQNDSCLTKEYLPAPKFDQIMIR